MKINTSIRSTTTRPQKRLPRMRLMCRNRRRKILRERIKKRLGETFNGQYRRKENGGGVAMMMMMMRKKKKKNKKRGLREIVCLLV